jgi:hypothetical protein
MTGAEAKTATRLTWAVEQRLAWIKESVEIFGFINREHIEKKFWVSVQQASADLKLAQERWPDLVVYNRSQKQYLRSAV